MNTKRTAFVTLLLGIAASLLGSAQARADGPLKLKGAPAVSPATLVPGKDATVTVEVSAAKEAAKVVLLQIRLGAQVIGSLAGESLGADKTGKYAVKIMVPADATGSVTLAIWGQGLLIGNVTTRVGGAAPAVVLDNRSMAAASAANLPKIEMPAGQVRSLAVDASVMAGSSAQGTVTLEAPARVTGTEVSLTSSSPAASVPQNVRVAGGSTTATFPIMAVPGGAPGNVTISAVVAGPGGVAKLATLRVWGVEQVERVRLSPERCPLFPRGGGGPVRPLAPGEECEVFVVLDRHAGQGGAQVKLSSSRADVTVPASVVVGPSPDAQPSQTSFLVRVAPGAGGGSATITAVADRPGGVPKQVTLALADPPAGQVIALDLPGVVEPGLTYNGIVRLDGPAGPGGVSVVLNCSSPAITVPSSVSVPAGALNAGFTARIGPTPAGLVTLSAARSGPGNAVASLRVKVGVNQVTEVRFPTGAFGAPVVVQWNPKADDSEHSSAPVTVSGTIALEAPAGPGGVSVALAANEAVTGVSVPASVLVPAGQSTAAFTATVGIQRKGPRGSRSSAPITAVRSGQPASEAKTVNLPIVWN